MNTNSVDFFRENEMIYLHDRCELIFAVWEIGNPGNIGNIIRLAHNIGAIRVLFINEKQEFNRLKIKKTAGFSFDQMSWAFISRQDFFKLTGKEHELIILETCNGAKDIYSVKLPRKVIILAGSESNGLPVDIIEKSKNKIFIPMPGDCKSMNVSHALAVAGFEWYRQMQ